MKSVPTVDLLMDKKMCAVLNTIPEQASVEPCFSERRFICVGLKMCKKRNTKQSKSTTDNFQCTGSCLLQFLDL